MKRSTLIVLLGLLTVSVGSVRADGMLMTAPWYYVQETAQQAILRRDADTGLQTMAILPYFTGDANQFAWVVPLPSPPAVSEGNIELFGELDQMTRPQWRYRDGDWDGCNTSTDYLTGAPGNDGVQIIDQRMVGYYQIMTVESDASAALIDSLTQWGFLHDGNAAAGEAIEHYVDEGWSFATVRIDSVSFHQTFGNDWNEGLYYGQLQPLIFEFASEEMIYPLRISAVSASESSEVVLYVADEHRRDFEGAVTRYANRFTADELADLNYRHAAAWLQPGEFLTHLRRNFHPEEMTTDLVIRRAASDQEFRLINYSGMPWMTVGLLGAPAAWFLWRRKRPRG